MIKLQDTVYLWLWFRLCSSRNPMPNLHITIFFDFAPQATCTSLWLKRKMSKMGGLTSVRLIIGIHAPPTRDQIKQ